MEIQEKRLKDTFVELVRVPCPSLQESEEAALLVRRLQDLGLSVQVDEAGRKCGGTTGNVWGFLPGTEPGATRLFFEAHMDSVAPATGTHVMERDGVLYSDGTTTLGGDDKSGIAAVLEALAVVQEKHVPHGDIQVCFTIGEETGSYGVRNLDPAWIRADVGYALDSTGHPGAIYNASPRRWMSRTRFMVKQPTPGRNRKKESMLLCWRHRPWHNCRLTAGWTNGPRSAST
jgi:tripeptide aminopeptidase